MTTQLRYFLSLITLLVLVAGAAQAASITVDAGGTCTLSDAITAANTDTATGGCPAGSGDDTITLEKDVTLAVALPTIESTITIEGQGHTIDGNHGNYPVLMIVSSGNLTLNKATLTGGNSPSGDGGGIHAYYSTVTLNSTTVSGNLGSFGGGVYAERATVTLNNSTVSGNAANDNGGGILALAATVTLHNSTVSGNSASSYGGGLYGSYSSTVTLKSCLISGNSAAQGKEIYSNNTVNAASYNLFGHSDETNAQAFSGFTPGASDVTATSDGTQPTKLDAVLSLLAGNSSPIKTHALPAGSPAIDLDATCSTGLSTDQRGYPRPVGSGCDAGAYEKQASITVDAGGICTLANAITAANTDAPAGGCPAGYEADTILIETDIAHAAVLPTITRPVTIEGQGHTIDGNSGSGTVFKVSSATGNLTLNKVTITGGSTAPSGGGILVGPFATVTLNNSIITNNTAGMGGGIYAWEMTTVTLNNSTVSNNSAGYGGGIFGYHATITLNNSTVSGNTATHSGGGLSAEFDTKIVLNNSTVSGNTADIGGGIYAQDGGAVTLKNATVIGNSAGTGGGLYVYAAGKSTLYSSIVSGNTATAGGKEVYNTSGTITAASHNLFGHSNETNAQAFSGFTPGTTDVTATSDGTLPTALAAILSPLANNGGPTQTHALPAGSPAVDLDAACSTGLSTDQRGYPRPVGAGCDAGAFEGGAVAQVNMAPIYKLLLFKRR